VLAIILRAIEIELAVERWHVHLLRLRREGLPVVVRVKVALRRLKRLVLGLGRDLRVSPARVVHRPWHTSLLLHGGLTGEQARLLLAKAREVLAVMMTNGVIVDGELARRVVGAVRLLLHDVGVLRVRCRVREGVRLAMGRSKLVAGLLHHAGMSLALVGELVVEVAVLIVLITRWTLILARSGLLL